MAQRVLIVGGTGQIGLAVARDLYRYTPVELILTGRDRNKGKAAVAEFGNRGRFQQLDINDVTADQLAAQLAGVDLAIQCAGPFRTLPPTLLVACIIAGVNYVDVCDDRRATQYRLGLHDAAVAANVTAIIDTGTFPGIDNVMVAAALARWPDAQDVRLYFTCSGSGSGGYGVLETTFLVVSTPYEQLINGQWRLTPSYRNRQIIDFGPPLGKRPVYNFEVPEVWSLPQLFPQLTHCTSQFGTTPELWNWATAALAVAPASIRTNPQFIHDSIAFTLPWVHKLDGWTGAELSIRVDVRTPDGRGESRYFYAPFTSTAVGWAGGAAAALILDGSISEPGVHLPETHLPPEPYFAALEKRGGLLRRTDLRP